MLTLFADVICVGLMSMSGIDSKCVLQWLGLVYCQRQLLSGYSTVRTEECFSFSVMSGAQTCNAACRMAT